MRMELEIVLIDGTTFVVDVTDYADPFGITTVFISGDDVRLLTFFQKSCPIYVDLRDLRSIKVREVE